MNISRVQVSLSKVSVVIDNLTYILVSLTYKLAFVTHSGVTDEPISVSDPYPWHVHVCVSS